MPHIGGQFPVVLINAMVVHFVRKHLLTLFLFM